MKVQLVLPPSVLEVFGSNFEQDFATMAGRRMVTARLQKDGHEVACLDCLSHKIAVPEMVRSVKAFSPDLIVMICIMSPEDVICCSKALIDGNVVCHKVCYGEAALNRRYILEQAPHMDAVIVGEPEETLAAVARALEGGELLADIAGIAFVDHHGVYTESRREAIEDLDTLGLPYLDDLCSEAKYHFMQTSRGCHGACTFCRAQAYSRDSLGSPWRARSPKMVVDEMEVVLKRFDISSFCIYDQEFMGGCKKGRQRAREIGDEILRRGLSLRFSFLCRTDDVDRDLFAYLKTAGLNVVFLGVESGCQAVLDRYRKGVSVAQNERAISILQDLKIPFQVGWLMYHPGVTLEEHRENLAFVRRTGMHRSIWFPVSVFNDLRLYYGTPEFGAVANAAGKKIEQVYEIFEYPFRYKERSSDILLAGLEEYHGLIKQWLGLSSFCLNQTASIIKRTKDVASWIAYVNRLKRFEKGLGQVVLEAFETALELINEDTAAQDAWRSDGSAARLVRAIDRAVTRDLYSYSNAVLGKESQAFFNEVLDYLIDNGALSKQARESFQRHLAKNT